MQAVLAVAPEGAATDAAARSDRALAEWGPVLSALHAALGPSGPEDRAAAAAALTAVLDHFADTDDWRMLVTVLRRIHAGDRDPDLLLAGLDDIDTTIVRRALDVLAGTATVAADAWHTLISGDEDAAGE